MNKIQCYADLCKAVADACTDKTLDEIGRDDRIRYLADLVQCYNNAYRDPPEGVVGVGAISYAEQKLREAQD